MFASGSSRALVAALLACVHWKVVYAYDGAGKAENELLPLVQQLHCAEDELLVRSLVRELKQLPRNSVGLPVESADSSSLSAGTLDLLLSSLIDQLNTYPQLRAEISQTLTSWNYCPVVDISGARDITVSGDAVSYSRVEYQSPANWKGFTEAANALMSHSSGSEPESQLHAKSFYFSASLRCLTEFTYSGSMKLTQRRLGGPTRLAPDRSAVVSDWPWSWRASCGSPRYTYAVDIHEVDSFAENAPVTSAPVTSVPVTSIPETGTPMAETLVTVAPATVVPLIDQEQHKAPLRQPVQTGTDKMPLVVVKETVFTGIVATNIESTDTVSTDIVAVEERSPERLVQQRKISLVAAGKARDKGILPAKEVYILDTQIVEIPAVENSVKKSMIRLAQPEQSELLGHSERSEHSERSGEAVYSGSSFKPVSSYTRRALASLSGTVHFNKRLEDSVATVGADVTFKPLTDSYWFARAGVTAVPGSLADTAGYRWGLGYDDWHAGTWFVQLNNWGPVSFGDGLDLENSVLAGGYKLKSETLDRMNITGSLSLSTSAAGAERGARLSGLADNVSANLTLQWAPLPDWFVRASFDRKFDGGPVRWSYVFGRYNWRANQLNFEYANYSQAKAFEPDFKSGSVGLSYNIKF